MSPETAAIQVLVLHDSNSPRAHTGLASIPVNEIVSVTDATPSGPSRFGGERCRIVLRELPTEPEPWVFRHDADDDPRPHELLVAETLMQVTALMSLASRVNRNVTTEDLGEEVAAAMRKPVRVERMPPLQFTKRTRFPGA